MNENYLLDKEKLIMNNRKSIFISHAAADYKLAKYFHELLVRTLPIELNVFRSTDDEGQHGIDAGAFWFNKIMEELNNANILISLLTKNSIYRPWVNFELGGIALKKLDYSKTNRDVIIATILFGVDKNNVSGPLLQFQLADNDFHPVRGIINKIAETLYLQIPSHMMLDDAVKEFVNKANASIVIDEVSFKINNNEVTISFGDILEKTGIVALSFNDYFDTLVDGEIISPKTNHGRFVKKYFIHQSDITELDKYIITALDNQRVKYKKNMKRIHSRGSNLLEGKWRKYPLGTIVEIPKNNNRYLLVAATRFNENNRSEKVNVNEFYNNVTKVLDFSHDRQKELAVNIPIFNSTLSRMDCTSMDLLISTLSILKMGDYKFINGINIVIPDTEKFRNEINLHTVRELYSSKTMI